MPCLKPRLPETAIKTAILEWLNLQKGLLIMPIDTVGIWDAKRGVFRKRRGYANLPNIWTRGVADILVYGPEVGLVAIEVKSARGRVRPEQKAFLGSVEALGGHALVARDWKEVADLFVRIRRPLG